MILKLPFVALEEDMNEIELCSRFVDLFLTGLFDDPDNGVYLHWTDETILKAKVDNPSRLRSGMWATKSCGVKWTSSLAYGEAKPAIQGDNYFVVCKDLIKVTMFCKEALDNQLFEGILAIQVIGRTVVFYLLTLLAQSLYALIPLAHIIIPDSLQSLPSLATEIPIIFKALRAFDRVCVTAAHSEAID
ncbi:hypothetical protein RMCBS344292_10188 [Rhizopus microsporus]|nr:hypothetical protein RMCBS344292_10188 [Rhizopus microsporus]